MIPVANAKAYNSLWQFKADAWSSLEDAAMEPGHGLLQEGGEECRKILRRLQDRGELV